MYFKYRRIPRKMKKKYKSILDKHSFLTLNQKLWFLLGEINPKHREEILLNIIKKL